MFLSLLVFLMGALSDKLDGLFARIQGVEKDEVGRVIDPVSDRIFIALSFLALYLAPMRVDVSWWAVFLTVGQDLLLAPLGAYITLKKRKIVVSTLGKLSTFYQYIFVLLVLLVNLYGIHINLMHAELLLVFLNFLSAGHHVYLWLLKGKSGVF